MKRRRIEVDVARGPDDDGRFRVMVMDGRSTSGQRWTLDRIKQAIGDGDDVVDKEEAA